jgi:restriction system protein
MRRKKTFSETLIEAWNRFRNRHAIQRAESVNMIVTHYWKEPYLKWMTESQKEYLRSRIEASDLGLLIMKVPELEIIRYLNEHEYAKRLVSRSKQLIHKDYYGDIKIDSWLNELDRFISDRFYQLSGAASSYPPFVLHIARAYKVEYLLVNDRDQIQSHVFDYINDLTYDNYDDDVDPTADVEDGFDYEIAIGTALERLGWSVRMTGGGADQGVDILAERDDILYAIQCKYYTSPVGNSAVQQVHAGAAYYGALLSAVVSNAPYTKSAMQLADSLGVQLLHDRNLDQL